MSNHYFFFSWHVHEWETKLISLSCEVLNLLLPYLILTPSSRTHDVPSIPLMFGTQSSNCTIKPQKQKLMVIHSEVRTRLLIMSCNQSTVMHNFMALQLASRWTIRTELWNSLRIIRNELWNSLRIIRNELWNFPMPIRNELWTSWVLLRTNCGTSR
jgi:hypothetical protein